MGEMGYLHLRVHGLVNLDERVNGTATPNLSRALFSAELVTSDYRSNPMIPGTPHARENYYADMSF
jgi:hypothetical protein